MTSRVLTFAGLACLALITLASPGATRMWASPWTLALWAALLLPATAVIVRAFDSRSPLALPSRGWLAAALAGAGVVALSALTSPYAGISVRWSAPLLASVAWFFLTFDWLHCGGPTDTLIRRDQLAKFALLAAFVLGGVSVGLWCDTIASVGVRRAIAARNAFPLGHSNYTAGLALLMLPLAIRETRRRCGAWRVLGAATSLCSLTMLFSSGSRGGLIGLASLVVVALIAAPLQAKTKWLLAAVAAAAGLVFVATNPRTRATFSGGADRQLVAASATQRSAMASAGAFMGADRPVLGWGPGTTPLVYPRYRAELAGGAENVLQLHSAPVHVWAELGGAGLATLLTFAALVLRARRQSPTAALTFAGYAAFALTDWQLDIPIFGAVIAALAASLAPVWQPTDEKRQRAPRLAVAACATIAIALVALLGRRDPTPELNVRALTLARDPASVDRAIALLRESLALNPDQEIAHFNLGWLLVVRDAGAAGRHFRAAAHLVPDKGGVYFGLGLALLNQEKRSEAAGAFALECLNDPAFLASPWWRVPAVAELREASADALARDLQRLDGLVARPTGLSPELLGRVPPGAERTYRRERTGYPVLMRNLDLAPPLDLFDVREPAAPPSWLQSLPAKGWLPAPLLLELLDGIVPTASGSRPANSK